MSGRFAVSAVFGRRLCATAAAGSALLHATMILHAANPVLALLILAMAGACLFCACELWRTCGPRTWAVVAVMNLAMIAVHWSVPAHHHGTAVPLPERPMSALMGLATTVSVVEALIAASVLYAITRGRDPL
ncbi:hypothetical protein FK535_19995 [Mycolicibacterium sp. 018/SC-01/001]|uniref:hypothetical protein n=1 Tax=Mycolicibacterium sp. 018/SC-01/001 TaxID=2592069 RepID=UPI00118034FC|nr:hypothetical protein [Mycolicibacterium sp. 018/SC-01/001]TRW80308.1 hypothetical protein FK535_19995 [Mycolicibacterium sp. 018/SC-01/001]